MRVLTVGNVIDASLELILGPEVVDSYEESFASRHFEVLLGV